jgi:glycosyltransferase involved in cell wall biosynthesis
MKVLQLITSINLGGAENVAFHLSEQCMKDSDELTEFTIVELYRSNTDYANAKRIELQEKKIKTYSLFRGNKRLSLIFAPFALLRLIKKEKPTAIHSHTDLPDLVLASTIRLMKIFRMNMPKIIRTIHNTELWPTHPRIAQYVESAFHDDVIIGVSKAALQAYFNIRKKTKLSVSPQNKVIYNGCNLPVPSDIEIALIPSKINIAFCGRFEYQKGVDVLIERIKTINKLYAEIFNFYFIGDGQLVNGVLELTQKFDNVIRHSAIASISNKLHHFDFILMPSRFEGLPLVSIEASFSKVPVIASKAPGLEETLPKKWALWFDLNNEKELLSVFEKIAHNKLDLKRLKEESFVFVNHHFTMNSMIQEYNKVYNQCLLKVVS